MENIISCIRIKPVLSPDSEEVVCEKVEEKSVLNLKTREVYNFGKTSYYCA